MEAYPLSPRNNAELRCKDVIEVFEIVRSKLGNHKQPVEQARLFAKMLGPSGNTINHISSPRFRVSQTGGLDYHFSIKLKRQQKA